jgi:hypothetical protein
LRHRAEHAAGYPISCASARKPSQRRWRRAKWSRRRACPRRRHGGRCSTLFCLLKATARDVDAVPCLSSGRENAPVGATTPHKQHACQQSHPSWHPAPPGMGSAREEHHAGLQGGCAAESTKGQRTRGADRLARPAPHLRQPPRDAGRAAQGHPGAVHLVERVLPHVPYRQWTLSFAHRVRWVLLKDAGLLSDVLTVFLEGAGGPGPRGRRLPPPHRATARSRPGPGRGQPLRQRRLRLARHHHRGRGADRPGGDARGRPRHVTPGQGPPPPRRPSHRREHNLGVHAGTGRPPRRCAAGAWLSWLRRLACHVKNKQQWTWAMPCCAGVRHDGRRELETFPPH